MLNNVTTVLNQRELYVLKWGLRFRLIHEEILNSLHKKEVPFYVEWKRVGI